MAVTLPCLACARPVTRSQSQMRGRVFCNRQCRSDLAHRDLLCRGCGRPYPRRPLSPGSDYCTWECFKASRHVIVDCAHCGLPFDTYVSNQRKHEKRDQVPCCSVDCRNRYTSLLLGGDGTWEVGGRYRFKDRGDYTYWRKIRAEYIRAIGGVCEGCQGAPVEQVHHLVPVARGGDLFSFDNLMGVCLDCHDNMHWQLLSGHFNDCLEEALREAV